VLWPPSRHGFPTRPSEHLAKLQCAREDAPRALCQTPNTVHPGKRTCQMQWEYRVCSEDRSGQGYPIEVVAAVLSS